METGLFEQSTNPRNWIYIARMYFGIDPEGEGEGGHIIGIKLVVYKVTVMLRERRVNET